MALSANQQGALFMVISQAGFTLNDMFVKLASYDLGVGQIMAVRGVFASAMIVALTVWLGEMRPLKLLFKPLMLVRVLGEIGATVAYLLALAQLPIANVAALFQSLPLVITMGAALFLNETVGLRRWSAIIVGFVGILLIVQPGVGGFSIFSLYVLICVLFCAARDLATRYIPDEVPTSFVSTLTSLAVTVCGILIIPVTGGWQPVSGASVMLLLTAAVLVLTGYHFTIMAMRVGDISFVSPFRYTNLLWAIVIGIVIFGDVPDTLTIIGSVIVVASGVYTLYRERVRGGGRPIAESTGPSNAVDGM